MRCARLSAVNVAIGMLGLCAAAPNVAQPIGQVVEIRSVSEFESVLPWRNAEASLRKRE